MFTDKLTLAIAEAAKKCMDEDLVGNQHKIDANKNGKIDADDFKKLRKEEIVNEEDGMGYVAFSHDGRKADIYANSSYEAHRKAIKHFNAPKAKHHMVHVKLAKKGGKGVVHTASESVQEGAIDDLRDRQAVAREANPFSASVKKSQPAKRVVQGYQYGGAKQKDEKEVDESVDMGQADKTLRTKSSSTKNTYHVKNKANKIISSHDNQSSAMRAAMKHDDHKVVKEDLTEDGKKYKEMNNIGKAKYTVSHHDGEQKHKDGSPFYGIKTFKNKVEKNKFTKDLHSKGYVKEEIEQIEESGGKVVYTSGDDHVEMYGEDSYAVYKNGKKQKFYSTLSAAKEALKEQVEELDESKDGWSKNDSLAKPVTSSQAMANHSQYFTKVTKLDSDGNPKKPEKSVKKEEVEELDESKAHIEQHLANKDINSKVTGKTVKVHSSDLASAKKHVKMAGYNTHKVVGGLNEDKMSDEDMQQREKMVKGMKKNLQGFKARYGANAEKVMYATATKQAMKEETVEKLDEVSLNKATDAYAARIKKLQSTDDKEEFSKSIEKASKSHAHIFNRYGVDGLNKANMKSSMREEVTNDQFKAELEDNKAKAAGTKKQPGVHKAAVQSVKQESFSQKLSSLKEGVRSFLKDRNND
jgi:hypothetical protein